MTIAHRCRTHPTPIVVDSYVFAPVTKVASAVTSLQRFARIAANKPQKLEILTGPFEVRNPEGRAFGVGLAGQNE